MSSDIFSHVEATISRRWIGSRPVDFDDVLMQIKDLGIYISIKGGKYVLAGSLEQIIDANRRLADLSFLEEASYGRPDRCNDVPSHSTLFEIESTQDEIRVLDVGTKRNHMDYVKSNCEQSAALNIQSVPKIPEPNDAFEHKAEQSLAAACSEDIESEIDEGAKASPKSCNLSRSAREIVHERDDPPSSKTLVRDLVVDSIIWDYIANVKKSQLKSFQELGLSLRKHKHGDCTTITVKPAKANALDVEMFDELHGNLVELCNEVTKNCVVEACRVKLDEECSRQILEELNSSYLDVLSMKCCDTGEFLFVGSAKEAREARRHFMTADPVRAATLRSFSNSSGARYKNLASESQEQRADRYSQFSRGFSQETLHPYIDADRYQRPAVDSGVEKRNRNKLVDAMSDLRDTEGTVMHRRSSLNPQQNGKGSDSSMLSANSPELRPSGSLFDAHRVRQKALASSLQDSNDSGRGAVEKVIRRFDNPLKEPVHANLPVDLSPEMPTPSASSSVSSTSSDQMLPGHRDQFGHARREPLLKQKAAGQGFAKQQNTKDVNQRVDVASMVESLLERGDEDALVRLLDKITLGDAAATEMTETLDQQQVMLTGKAGMTDGLPSVGVRRSVDDSDSSLTSAVEFRIPQKSYAMKQVEPVAKSSSIECVAQPEHGKFSHVVDEKMHLPGHEGQGTIIVAVSFCSSVQQSLEDILDVKGHHAMDVTFYLPASDQGRRVHLLMKQAFDKRKLFRVNRGGSKVGTVVPNDIDLKTVWNTYPDPSYLTRVATQLEDLLGEKDGKP